MNKLNKTKTVISIAVTTLAVLAFAIFGAVFTAEIGKSNKASAFVIHKHLISCELPVGEGKLGSLLTDNEVTSCHIKNNTDQSVTYNLRLTNNVDNASIVGDNDTFTAAAYDTADFEITNTLLREGHDEITHRLPQVDIELYSVVKVVDKAEEVVTTLVKEGYEETLYKDGKSEPWDEVITDPDTIIWYRCDDTEHGGRVGALPADGAHPNQCVPKGTNDYYFEQPHTTIPGETRTVTHQPEVIGTTWHEPVYETQLLPEESHNEFAYQGVFHLPEGTFNGPGDGDDDLPEPASPPKVAAKIFITLDFDQSGANVFPDDFIGVGGDNEFEMTEPVSFELPEQDFSASCEKYSSIVADVLSDHTFIQGVKQTAEVHIRNHDLVRSEQANICTGDVDLKFTAWTVLPLNTVLLSSESGEVGDSAEGSIFQVINEGTLPVDIKFTPKQPEIGAYADNEDVAREDVDESAVTFYLTDEQKAEYPTGSYLWAWFYSNEHVYSQVQENGTITFQIPQTLEEGAHRVALTSPFAQAMSITTVHAQASEKIPAKAPENTTPQPPTAVSDGAIHEDATVATPLGKLGVTGAITLQLAITLIVLTLLAGYALRRRWTI